MATSREQQLLSVGKQCSHQTCLLVDFLPFKCQHCESSFCQEHFMVTAHKCPKYDEAKYNRVSPNCPLCNVVVSVRPGQDANEAVENHFVKDCSVMTGKAKARSTPTCARPRCGKALFAPIRCTNCSRQFCATHRFPADHSCTAPAQTTTTGPTAASRLLDLNAKASAAGASTLGAIKAMASSAQANSSRPAAPKAAPAPKAAAPQAPSKPNLFSKTDRRARAERDSRRKAMLERAKKGLLSEEEKLALATEEAERAQHGEEDKKDCVIM
ncbi:hypothetical protein C8R47DRAFT_1140349 [Mycena vitilis]|nr:hypothetical protein C8R47DRAFT_1140349 [Mycena vitilis]